MEGNRDRRRTQEHYLQLVGKLGVRSQVLQPAVNGSLRVLDLVKLIDEYKVRTDGPGHPNNGRSHLARPSKLVGGAK